MLIWNFNDNLIFKNKKFLEGFFKKKIEEIFFISNLNFVQRSLLKYNLKKVFNWLYNITYLNKLVYLNFEVGDILNLYYNLYSKAFFFQGICIFKKNKKFKYKNSLVMLRSKISNINVQIFILWYATRAYLSKLNIYRKNKLVFYKKSKIYYIGNKFKVI